MKSVKKVSVALLALLLSLSLLALMGCGGGAAPAASSGTESSGTAASGTESSGSASSGSASSGASAGAAIDQTWQGAWYSKSEIVPPEQETDQYDVEIAADGSFVLNDSGKELYSGTIEVTNEPEDGYGDATVDGKTVKVQLVSAQGIYKFIFNAGDDWDKSMKKIVFQR